MADVNFYLRDPKSPKDTGVMLFFSFNGKRFKVATIEKINPKYWNEKTQKAKQIDNFPTYPEFNQRLLNFKTTCLNVYRRCLNDNNQVQPLPATIKNLIKEELFGKVEKEKSVPFMLTTFADHLTNEIKSGRRTSKKGTPLSNSIYKIYKTNTEVLKEFEKTRRSAISFDDVTDSFYHGFMEFLRTKRRYSPNTIGKHIGTLKAILKAAGREGHNTRTDYLDFATISEEVDNIYLNEVELKQIADLDLSDPDKFIEIVTGEGEGTGITKVSFTSLDKVRDLFLVGCWTGLRFSDFSKIQAKHFKNGFIEIKTQKTGRNVVIPIHPTVEEIINKYQGLTENSLPPAISNQKMNQFLKGLGKLAGICALVPKGETKAGITIEKNVPKYTMISTHCARRSFSTNAYNLKVPALSIMAITGHKTESNFLRYIKVTPQEHAIELRNMWQRENKLKVVV